MIWIKGNTGIAALFFLGIGFGAVDAALAHRVNVFAWAEGDTVYVESTFADGRKVKAGKIIVKDPQGNELLGGITDDQGEFSFKVPQRTDLKIVLVAGQGHQAEWTIRASELEVLSANPGTGTGAAKALQAEREEPIPKTSLDTMTEPSDSAIKPEELEAIIETVLDRKLRPLTRMLAAMQHEGPTAKDIFAGIGYIFGLVGVAAYVQARKKKE